MIDVNLPESGIGVGFAGVRRTYGGKDGGPERAVDESIQDMGGDWWAQLLQSRPHALPAEGLVFRPGTVPSALGWTVTGLGDLKKLGRLRTGAEFRKGIQVGGPPKYFCADIPADAHG